MKATRRVAARVALPQQPIQPRIAAHDAIEQNPVMGSSGTTAPSPTSNVARPLTSASAARRLAASIMSGERSIASALTAPRRSNSTVSAPTHNPARARSGRAGHVTQQIQQHLRHIDHLRQLIGAVHLLDQSVVELLGNARVARDRATRGRPATAVSATAVARATRVAGAAVGSRCVGRLRSVSAGSSIRGSYTLEKNRWVSTERASTNPRRPRNTTATAWLADVQIGDNVVWRSVLKPGWSWTKNAEPREGMDFCPAFHHEYVVQGTIVYRMRDGTSVECKQGDFVIIEPGHAGEVTGKEDCILIDW